MEMLNRGDALPRRQRTCGHPEAIVDRLESDLRAIVAMPDFREALGRNGADPLSTTSTEFAKMIGDDLVRYGKAVKAANIKLD